MVGKRTVKRRRYYTEEMFAYRAVFTLRTFRLLQEVANAEGKTIIAVLSKWVTEGYARWQRAQPVGGRVDDLPVPSDAASRRRTR